jgi:hypothetical protein
LIVVDAVIAVAQRGQAITSIGRSIGRTSKPSSPDCTEHAAAAASHPHDGSVWRA